MILLGLTSDELLLLDALEGRLNFEREAMEKAVFLVYLQIQKLYLLTWWTDSVFGGHVDFQPYVLWT